MTSSIRSWLPVSAFSVGALRPVLSGALSTWAATWIGDREVQLSVARVGGMPDADAFQGSGHAARAHISARARRTFLEAALHVDLSQVSLQDNDRKLLDALVEKAALDLIETLPLPQPDDSAQDGSWCQLAIALAGRDLFTIWAPTETLAQRLKARTASPRIVRPPVARRTQAIRSAMVQVEAIVGRGALSVSQLETLAPGDVIVLDETLKAGIALVAAGTTLARGRLGRDGTKPSIHL